MSKVFKLETNENLPQLSIKTGLVSDLLNNNEEFISTNNNLNKGDLYIAKYPDSQDGVLVLYTGHQNKETKADIPLFLGGKAGPLYAPLVGQGVGKAPQFSRILQLGEQTKSSDNNTKGQLSIVGPSLSCATLKYDGENYTDTSHETSVDTIINLPEYAGAVRLGWKTDNSQTSGTAIWPIYASDSGEMLPVSATLGSGTKPFEKIVSREFVLANGQKHDYDTTIGGKLSSPAGGGLDAASLVLGNSIGRTSTTNGPRYGEIKIYSKSNAGYATLQAHPEATTGTTYYFPSGKGVNKTYKNCYGVWMPSFASSKQEEVEGKTTTVTYEEIKSIGSVNQPVYVDSDGKVTICAGDLGTTDTPWTSVLTNNITLINSLSSKKGYETPGSLIFAKPIQSGTIGLTTLELGVSEDNNSRQYRGQIILHGKTSTQQNIIRYPSNPSTQKAVPIVFELPAIGIGTIEEEDANKLVAAAVWHGPNVSRGDGTTPVYIHKNGQALPCSKYAGGTSIILNNENGSGKSIEFFAPKESGDPDAVLMGGNGDAPKWVAFSSLTALKATQDGSGNNIIDYYETKGDASSKLEEAKKYTDTQILNYDTEAVAKFEPIGAEDRAKAYADDIKTDLLGKGVIAATYDTLKEIADWIGTHEGETVVDLTDAIAQEAVNRQNEINTLKNLVPLGDNGISIDGNLGTLTISGVDATDEASGVVSTSEQTFSGTKTFKNDIEIFSSQSKKSIIKNRSTTTDTTFYLPSNIGSAYAIWSPSGEEAVGSTTQPVYIDSSGQTVVCDDYKSLFTNFSSSGNTLSATVGDTKKEGIKIINSFSGSWTTGTASGPTFTLEVNGVTTGLQLPSAAAEASGVVTTTTQTFAGNKTFSGVVQITNSTASTDSGKGALVVTGGVGIAGQLSVAGNAVLGNAYEDQITINGKMVLVKDRTYGTSFPTSNLKTGQIYFKLL